MKEDIDSAAATKRRKLKRDHASPSEPGEYSPVIQQSPLPPSMGMAPSFDARERGDRKGILGQHRAGYTDEQGSRVHGKETMSKNNRREMDQYPLPDLYLFQYIERKLLFLLTMFFHLIHTAFKVFLHTIFSFHPSPLTIVLQSLHSLGRVSF